MTASPGPRFRIYGCFYRAIGARELQLAELIAGYEEFNDFDTREIKWIEALRTARMVYYSAWLARRWDDPAFPAAFPWFGQERYWADQILALREQLALLEEEPLRLRLLSRPAHLCERRDTSASTPRTRTHFSQHIAVKLFELLRCFVGVGVKIGTGVARRIRVKGFHHLGRIARHHHIGRHVAGDNCSGSNHAVISNGHAFQHRGMVTHPDVIAEPDRRGLGGTLDAIIEAMPI
jgi:hypothetical protein